MQARTFLRYVGRFLLATDDRAAYEAWVRALAMAQGETVADKVRAICEHFLGAPTGGVPARREGA